MIAPPGLGSSQRDVICAADYSILSVPLLLLPWVQWLWAADWQHGPRHAENENRRCRKEHMVARGRWRRLGAHQCSGRGGEGKSSILTICRLVASSIQACIYSWRMRHIRITAFRFISDEIPKTSVSRIYGTLMRSAVGHMLPSRRQSRLPIEFEMAESQRG